MEYQNGWGKHKKEIKIGVEMPWRVVEAGVGVGIRSPSPDPGVEKLPPYDIRGDGGVLRTRRVPAGNQEGDEGDNEAGNARHRGMPFRRVNEVSL